MRKVSLICILLTICTVLSGCSTAASKPVSRTSTFFDTVIRIDIYDKNGEEILDDCMQLCQNYEKKLSRTLEGSEIYQLNHAQGQPVELSPETVEVIQIGLKYCEISEGYFDITIAPLADLWDIPHNTGTIPDSSAISSALSHVNYGNVRIDGNTVQLLDPSAAIDLGGIAKGYIADRLKEYMEGQGVSHALINLGGNVLAVGAKPDGSSFNIGIQYPFKEQGEAITSVKIKDRSLVSSGTYQRYFQADGKIYHHILNPNTGYPCDNNLLAVSVIADSSADADGLSTTCFLLGAERGMELINNTSHAEALFITDDYKIHYSSGFRK